MRDSHNDEAPKVGNVPLDAGDGERVVGVWGSVDANGERKIHRYITTSEDGLLDEVDLQGERFAPGLLDEEMILQAELNRKVNRYTHGYFQQSALPDGWSRMSDLRLVSRREVRVGLALTLLLGILVGVLIEAEIAARLPK